MGLVDTQEDGHMSENSSDLGAFLAGFVIGGLVGAATAIILAPQSGAATRAQISTKGSELAHSGSEQYYQYLNTASAYTDRAGTALSNTAQQVGQATGRVQDQARIVLDRGNSAATETDDVSQANGQSDSSEGDAA